jgi:hypothetical protein
VLSDPGMILTTLCTDFMFSNVKPSLHLTKEHLHSITQTSFKKEKTDKNQLKSKLIWDFNKTPNDTG